VGIEDAWEDVGMRQSGSLQWALLTAGRALAVNSPHLTMGGPSPGVGGRVTRGKVTQGIQGLAQACDFQVAPCSKTVQHDQDRA
jgi:hypothetical protein